MTECGSQPAKEDRSMTAAQPGTAAEPAGAVVVGASGGLGGALVAALLARGAHATVLALSRDGGCPAGVDDPRLAFGRIDVTDEASVAAAAARAAALAPPRLVIVASGLLHSPDGLRPEKTFAAIDPAAFARLFAVNATGPALVAKHLLPRMPRTGRTVFAAVSARVGSIGDNRLGGWYGYRASKAALNMLLRTLAIERARTAPDAVVLGLHPGTVDTALSAPFQAAVADGRLFSPDRAAGHLLDVLERSAPADSGRVLAWDGAALPP
jgi:NAD(P)-dependent dehydrogenase (short-subunit alcohol dehydrogenase family)